MSTELTARGSSATSPPDGPRGLRRAAAAARIATVTLVLSAIALALFFGGMGAFFGPINDVLFGATFLLLVPAILATHRLAGRTWFSAAALVAILAIVELGIGQALLVTGVISLGTSFATLGIGMAGVMVWAIALAALALRDQLLTPAVGTWLVAFGIALVLAAAGWAVLPLALWSVLGIAFFGTFVGWLWSLGTGLEVEARRSTG